MVHSPLKNINLSWFWNFLSYIGLKDNREKEAQFRTIYVNIKTEEKPIKYASNAIKTSKYNIINFLPKNLFEQFRRVANFYFLVNCIIIFVVPDPPTSPFTSILPLLFVVIVTAIKQAYEDILKHRSDNQTNNTPVRVLRDGQFQDKKWKDIKVGDIVEVLADGAFPCDLVLLYTKTSDGMCFITTANLDGETNLKQRSVPKNLSSEDLDSEARLANFRAVIECDKPNLNLYEFKGKFIVGDRQVAISNENVLLRGARLKIAPVAYGCAIYTGKDTKVMLNSKFKSNKFSCIEKKLNLFIIIFLILLAVLTFLCFGLSFIYNNIYLTDWYVFGMEPSYYSNKNLYNFIILVYYMNLLNYIVPLSMYVTIELQRFVGSQFIEWDLNLYDEKSDEPAKANTSDLNEDLGQVEYLFSDKTGTLTENLMIFKQFAVNGRIYEERSGRLYEQGSDIPVRIEDEKDVRIFLESMTLCHTVEYDPSNAEPYQASSPDELSFVDFANKLGIRFMGDRKTRANKIRRMDFLGRTKEYEILQILEFDSTRKKMTVILRELGGRSDQYILFCKGADSSIVKECLAASRDVIPLMEQSITYFGQQGWRTLAFAYKYITPDEYMQYERLLADAYNDIMNRDQKLAEAFDKIESGLTLLGATGIEDKLQDDVETTLESLRFAGIKIWVLTGDKTETAINISHTCKHFSKRMEKMFLVDLTDRDRIMHFIGIFKEKTQNISPGQSFALIVDGKTLGIIYNANLENEFREVSMRCDAVLCCRMTPAQKALIVKLVKKSKKKPITAAIGDGANDVSMIQEAHIGLGIYGKEGRNAAKSADFSFAKFKYVKRIFLVHGYLYYTRSSILVQYFFYKNVAFVVCQVYYAFWNAFSVTSLYGSIVLTVYNITLTAAPILLFGLFEQNKPIAKIKDNPAVYRSIAKNRLLSMPEFLKWMALGTWHSLVAYFFTFFLIMPGSSYQSDGKMNDNYEFGAIVITIVILVVHVKLFTEWHYQTYFTLIGYLLSLLGYIIFLIVPNSFIIPSFIASLFDYQSTYWIYFNLLSQVTVWLLFFVAVAAALLPDITLAVISNVIDKRNIVKKLEEIRNERKDDSEPAGNDIQTGPSSAVQHVATTPVNYDPNRQNSMHRRRSSLNPPQPNRAATAYYNQVYNPDEEADIDREVREMVLSAQDRRNFAPINDTLDSSLPSSRIGASAITPVIDGANNIYYRTVVRNAGPDTVFHTYV